ncbi:unnamed protein product [Pleuronectes platessa]|uniref:Uncharacterized protein n=1 Tax=Pleuronectes platessa TaxID=8262 RepID=A0A9N7V3G4_PLEPL|nr:unnamed protein product [Pleuronectes platessa]
MSKTSRTAANLFVARLQCLVLRSSKRNSFEYVWNILRSIVAQNIARPVPQAGGGLAPGPVHAQVGLIHPFLFVTVFSTISRLVISRMMFSNVGGMNRRNVEAMSPARDFAYIVGPSLTPLGAASTALEEQRLPSWPLLGHDSQGTQSPRGCNRMLHVLGSGQYHTKASRLPSLSSSIPPRAEGCYSLSFSHPTEDSRAFQPNLLFPPTTGGQRYSSQLTPLKEISSPFKLYKTPRSDAISDVSVVNDSFVLNESLQGLGSNESSQREIC